MAILNLGSVLIGAAVIIYYKIKAVWPEFLNFLSDMVFVFPPSLQTKRLQFIQGQSHKIAHLPFYSTLENFSLIIFAVTVLSAIYGLITLADPSKAVETLRVFVFVFAGASFYVLARTVAALAATKNRLYYAKFGVVIGAAVSSFLYLLEMQTGDLAAALAQLEAENRDILANLSFYFDFELSAGLVEAAVGFGVLGVFTLAVGLNFMSLCNALYSVRIMNRHLKTIRPPNADTAAILARYRRIQGNIYLQMLATIAVIVASLLFPEKRAASVLLGAALVIALKLHRLPEELRVLLSKHAESVFQLSRVMEQRGDQKLTADIKEGFIKVSKRANNAFSRSAKVTVLQLGSVMFLLWTAAFALLMGQARGAKAPFILKPEARVCKNSLGWFQACVLGPRRVCLGGERALAAEHFARAAQTSPFAFLNEALKVAFYAYQDFVLEFLVRVILLYLVYEALAFFAVFIFMRKIKY